MNQVIDFASTKANCTTCAQAANCLPQNSTADQVKQFSAAIKRKRIMQRGSHLYLQNDTFTSLYLLRSGSVKVYTLDDEGEEQVLGFYLPGDVLALDGIGDGRHHSNAMVLETAMVCELSYPQFTTLLHEIAGFQAHLNGMFGNEIARDHALLQLLGKKSAEQRLAGFLLNMSARFAKRGYSASEFRLSMSRQDIGAYLGLALETVSRLLTRLQQQGVLTVNRRNVAVLDPGKLRQLAGAVAGRQPQHQRQVH